nr:hypothetical protein Iba_chr07bCG14260 [Ipomoea batatas]
MVSKSFSLIFSLLLITAFLCFTTTNATSRRLLGPNSPHEAGDGIVGIPAPPYKVPNNGSPKGDAPFAVKKTIGSPYPRLIKTPAPPSKRAPPHA